MGQPPMSSTPRLCLHAQHARLTAWCMVGISTRRGYTDDLPAAAALQLLVEEGNVVLVDIRTAKEKESAGVPDLPSAATSKVGVST